MGLIGALFPFSAATQLSEHNGAFLWMNFRNIFGIIALITYIIAWVVFVVVSVVTLGFGLFFMWAIFIIWLPFDLIALVLGIPGTLFHIMSCKNDEGIGSAFTSFGLSVVGVCVISMYNWIFHIISWVLVFVGIGLFTLVIVYIICLVCFILAFLAAKKEA